MVGPVTQEAGVSDRFEEAVARFDAANAQDPHHDSIDGVPQPKELIYSRRVTASLARFAPDASEEVQLAARCQHIQRWTIPRSTYPDGRDGYRAWRTDLARFHADTAGAILRGIGYNATAIGRVQSLLRKERLKIDPEVQLLEDVVCLVFLQHYLVVFVTQHTDLKVADILRKTWRKMSKKGRHAALKLDLPDDLRALITRAIA